MPPRGGHSHRSRLHGLAVALVAASLLLPIPVGAGTSHPAPSSLSWSNDASPAGAGVQGVGGSSDLLVASAFEGAPYMSADGGLRWTPIEDFPPVRKGRVAFDPTDATVGYVAGYGGVARTLDGGRSWTLALDVARAARVHVAADGHVAVGARLDDGSNRVLVSADRGATWADWDAPIPDLEPVCGIAFGRSARELMVMTDERSWFTRDGGASWTETPGAGLNMAADASGVAWRADVDRLERSLDGGATWEAVAAPALGGVLAAHPSGGVYLASTDGLILTRDGGVTWTNLGARGVMAGTEGIFPDPRDADAVLLAHLELGAGRVAPDGAGGHAFEGRAAGMVPADVDAIAGAGGLLVAVGPLGVFASRDGGARWSHAGAGYGLPELAAVAVGAGGATAFVGGRDHLGAPLVLASEDAARTFHAITLPAGAAGRVTGIAADPEDPFRAYAAVATTDLAHHVYATEDAGASWTRALTVPVAPRDAAWADGAAVVATDAGLLARSGAGVWAPLAGPPAGSALSALPGGGLAVASGDAVWRSLGDSPAVAPWARAGDAVADVAAGPVGAWSVTASGSLLFCAGPDLGGACENASPPSGHARAVHASADGARVFAGTMGAGLWAAALRAP